MEAVVEAERSHSVGDASMEYGGVNERVCLGSPFLPPIPIMRFNRGLLLTVLHFCCGLRLHPNYNYFRGKVEGFLWLSAVPTTGEQEIDTALGVIRTAREAKKNDDHGKMGNDHQDEDMVDKVGQPLAFVGVVDNATEEFSLSPMTCTAAFSNFMKRGIDTRRGISTTPSCKRLSDRSLRIVDSLPKPRIAWL